jgi:hypothetical protein
VDKNNFVWIRNTYSNVLDKVCQWLATGQRFFPGTDDISEILLKDALNTINLNQPVQVKLTTIHIENGIRHPWSLSCLFVLKSAVKKKCLCWLWLKVKLQWYGIFKKISPHVAKIKPRDFSTNRQQNIWNTF